MTDLTPGHPGWHGSLEGEPVNDTPTPSPDQPEVTPSGLARLTIREPESAYDRLMRIDRLMAEKEQVAERLHTADVRPPLDLGAPPRGARAVTENTRCDYRHCPCFDGTQWEMANCECACHSTAIVHRSTYTSKGAQLLRGAKGLVVWTPEE